jgi:hypothetical protein
MVLYIKRILVVFLMSTGKMNKDEISYGNYPLSRCMNVDEPAALMSTSGHGLGGQL